jgi:hypothetical protein
LGSLLCYLSIGKPFLVINDNLQFIILMETLLLILILAAAVGYIVYRLYRLFAVAKKDKTFKGCAGCSAECPLMQKDETEEINN